MLVSARTDARTGVQKLIADGRFFRMRRRRGTPPSDRLRTWTILVIATVALLSLSSGLTFSWLGQPALAARLKPSVLQQKPPSSKAKKLSGRTDPKSVLAAPGGSRTAPQPPRFQLSLTSQPVRVGEPATFSLQPVNLLREFSRGLVFYFGDKSPLRSLEGDSQEISHWYSAEGDYPVSVYLGDPKGAQVNDPVIVHIGPWSLRPVPAEVDIGEEVFFEIDNPPTDKGFEYWFHFDDDDSPADGWRSKWQASHRYHSAGTHQPYAEVRRVIDGSTKAAQTARLQISVRRLPDADLRLSVVPNDTVQVGKDVKFTATLECKFDKDDSHIRYRFEFGDTEHGEWQPSTETTHRYSLAGTHPAQVEVAWVDEQSKIHSSIATSKPPYQIVVTPIAQVNPPPKNVPPSSPSRGEPNWKLITISALAVVALAILFAGYQTLKGHFSVKPDYRAHRDIGFAQVNGGSLAMEFDIHLKPDVTEARYQLEVPEAGLIRYERRQHE